MKIVMFTNHYLPHISGVATSMSRSQEGLMKRGHEVYIFAPTVPNPSNNVIKLSSIPVPYFKVSIPFPWTPGLKKHIRNINPDIVHAHHPFLIGKTARKMAHFVNAPLVFTWHAMYEEYVHYIPLIPDRLLRNPVIATALAYAENADAIIAPTESVKNILLQRGIKTNIEVIPTGIDLSRFEKISTQREQTRTSWGIKDNTVVIVSLARISEEKNFPLLLRAIHTLANKDTTPPFAVVIGGDGPALQGIKKLARDLSIERHVRFTGLIPHEHVPTFLAGGDIFAYPSVSETQGLVVLEALAAGIPAVVMDAPGNRDIVQNRKQGIVTSHSEHDFTNAICSMIQNAKLRSSLAKNSTNRAALFSIERMAEQLEALYVSLR